VTTIAMSRFGQKQLRDSGIESTYIPHCVNTQVFKPTAETHEGPPRKIWGIPDDAFVVMIAAANIGIAPPRKAWAEMFLAASYFLKQHPDAYLFLHTDTTQEPPGGLDLDLLARAVDMPLDRLKAVDAYAYATGRVSQTDLAAMYSAADVLLASSMGEGFGIPVIEAQACGTPVIVSDFSAQPELAASGWLVKGQPYWDPLQAAFFFMPHVQSIVARLEDAYAARGDEQLKVQAIAKAAQYDSDLVFDRYWRPFLKVLEAKLERPVPSRGPNRSERRAKKRRAA
jgi:glycosyltransferase involved in cell wall biosynthesis